MTMTQFHCLPCFLVIDNILRREKHPNGAGKHDGQWTRSKSPQILSKGQFFRPMSCNFDSIFSNSWIQNVQVVVSSANHSKWLVKPQTFWRLHHFEWVNFKETFSLTSKPNILSWTAYVWYFDTLILSSQMLACKHKCVFEKQVALLLFCTRTVKKICNLGNHMISSAIWTK